MAANRISLWRLRHESTHWHANLEDDEEGAPNWDELDKIKGASHEAYVLNSKLTSETFRYKFLNYNRPWLLAQLPSILTPRTLRRSRPYLTQQLNKILGSVNPDVSSDDEADGDGHPRFGPVALSNASRNIIRLWLAQARRRRVLREIVQPLINRSRKAECQQCLSRQQLQVEMLTPIEKLGDDFDALYPSEVFDQRAWKEYFTKHAQIATLCLTCIGKHRENVRNLELLGDGAAQQYKDKLVSHTAQLREDGPVYGPVSLNAASKAILLLWLRKAQISARRNGRGAGIRTADVSDDDSDDDRLDVGAKFGKVRLSAASKAIMLKWVALGKERAIAQGKTGGNALAIAALRNKRRKKKGKANAFGF